MVSLARFAFHRHGAFENGFEPAPALASLGAPLATTHRVITYTYDPVGNRLSLTTTVDVVNYQYDAANRLTGVNGQAYTWDDNGNLLSDGLRSYTYDHANRLTQVVSGTLTTGFAYNGAGDRVGKTVDGVTTDHVLDPAAGLTQVLQETTDGQVTSYLYGLDLLAQYDSGTWAYHVNDGLGSVRQLADPTGQAVASYSFSPFGVPLEESGGEPYGFTGEQWDASTGLVYLRARWYEPGVGRFTQRDVQPGDYRRSLTLNDYLYVAANPINYTDPSGLCLDEDFDGICDDSEPDYRDLTDWLYGEMVYNTNDSTVRKLRTWNMIAKGGTGIGLIACGVGLVGDQPVIVVGGGVVIVGGTVLEGAALNEFAQQVKNGARWDFKDEIGLKLGPGITLYSSSTCFNDIEYSVPGNIHFAYIGGAAGFFGVEIQAGAAWAEIHDPAHDPQSPECVGPYEGVRELGPTWWDPSTWNLGDEPMDHEAVTLGIKLWEKYGDSLTRAQFEGELGSYINRLAHHEPRARPVAPEYAKDWPYPIGYFDNVGNVYNINQEQP